ncbi:MAG: hypothetical protein NTW93_10240 [Phycisphaerae bacterium]|nr:hypothetical protein [Phycisphaerae bacterium]
MKKAAATRDTVFLRFDFWLRILLAIAVSLPSGQIAYAQKQQQKLLQQQRTDYFKLVSTVEYIAQQDNESRQYRHQAEPWFMVTTIPQTSEQTHYHLITSDLQFKDANAQQKYRDAGEINYDLNAKKFMAGVDADLLHLQKMNNESVKTIDGTAPNEVGKTWTVRFNLGTFNHYSLPNELKFTVTSIKVPTDKLGDFVAVRAISDPFLVKAAAQTEGYGYVKCKIACVYLFDPYSEITGEEDIYVSAMVFLATTKMDGMTQQYRYEFGTYKTDANAASADMNGLGFELEGFVREIQLIPQPIEVKKPCGLPIWAQSEIVNAAQLASACAAVACEQNIVNPVASIYLAAARVYQLQDECSLIPAPCERSVCQALRYDVEEIYPMDICGRKAFPLWWLGAIPLATIHHSHHHDKSPYKP